MWVNVQSLIMPIILIFMLIPFGLIIGLKQYFSSKAKGKMIVNKIYQNEEGISSLVPLEGQTTKVDKQNRAYIPKGKRQATKLKKDIVNGKEYVHDTGQPITDKDGEPVYVGNTYETYYPEGLPRWLQTRIRKMDTPIGNPMGVNYYGNQEYLQITDDEIGLIHREAFTKAAISASSDAQDVIREMSKMYKPQSFNLLYIMMGLNIVVAIAGIALSMGVI